MIPVRERYRESRLRIVGVGQDAGGSKSYNRDCDTSHSRRKTESKKLFLRDMETKMGVSSLRFFSKYCTRASAHTWHACGTPSIT